MTFDLKAALGPVWRGEVYYARREVQAVIPTTDPDGRTRDTRSEAEAKRWAGERADVLAWLPEKAIVYDLGCGDGKLKLARPDLRVYGYDPDPTLQRLALTRGCVVTWSAAHAFSLEGATPLPCSDDENLPIADALWCCHVVEHMETPVDDLREALTLVRSGGTVVVETPDFGSPVALEWGDRFRLLHDPTHVSLFTAESLVRMLRDLGVEVQEVAWPGYFGTPLQERREELWRPIDPYDVAMVKLKTDGVSPPAPGNVVAVRGKKL